MTSTKKWLEERRARNHQIAANDAANRCTFCRRELPKVGVLLMLTPGGQKLRYCNDDCRQDHSDALHTMEVR